MIYLSFCLFVHPAKETPAVLSCSLEIQFVAPWSALIPVAQGWLAPFITGYGLVP